MTETSDTAAVCPLNHPPPLLPLACSVEVRNAPNPKGSPRLWLSPLKPEPADHQKPFCHLSRPGTLAKLTPEKINCCSLFLSIINKTQQPIGVTKVTCPLNARNTASSFWKSSERRARSVLPLLRLPAQQCCHESPGQCLTCQLHMQANGYKYRNFAFLLNRFD